MAAVRPDAVNLPLLVHVLGAMVLVGALATVLTALVLSRRGDGAALTALGFKTLLYAALPAFVVTRAGAEWVRSEQNADEDAAWIGIGYMTSDAGLLFLVVATVLAGLGLRRVRRQGGGPGGLGTAATVLLSLALLGYLIAIWAMTTKPD